MAVNIGTIEGTLSLRDTFSGVIDSASVKLQQSSTKLQRIGSQMSSIGATLSTRITAPILGAAGAAFKFGTDFQDSLTRIETLVGINSDQVEEWAGEILELAGPVALAPEKLADAMFFVTSAGLRGTEALDTLTAAAQASALGLGEAATIADATTSAMNAYGPANLSAAEATNILALAVRAGKLEASELAPVLGRLLPTASALKISFDDVAGVLAVMSRTGLDAAEASTSLGAIFTAMLKPTSGAKEALGEVGLTLEDLRTVAAGPDGVVGVMRLLEERFAGNDEALVRVVPNVRAFRGVMNVLAQDASVVDDVMDQVSSGVDVLGSGMSRLEQDAGFRFRQFLAEARVRLIELGDTLEPVFNLFISVGNTLLDWAGSAINIFGSLSPPVQAIGIALAGVVTAAGPVIFVFGQIATAAGALGITFASIGTAISSVLAVVLGPVGLIAAGGALLLSWRPVREFLWELATNVFATLRQWVIDAIATLQQFWESTSTAREFLANLANVIIDDVVNSIQTFISNVTTLVSNIVEFGARVVSNIDMLLEWAGVYDAVRSAIGYVIDKIRDLWDWMGRTLTTIYEWVGGLDGIITALDVVVPGLGAVIDKFRDWATRAAEATGKNRILVTSAYDVAESADDTELSISDMDAAMRRSIQSTTGLDDVATDLGSTLTTTTPKISRLVESLDDVEIATIDNADIVVELDNKYLELLPTIEQVVVRTGDLTESQDDATDSSDNLGDATQQLGSKFQTLMGIVSQVGDIFSSVFGMERTGQFINNLASIGQSAFDAFQGFASGNYLQGIQGVVSGVGALVSTFKDLFSGEKVEEKLERLFGYFEEGTGTLANFNKIAEELTYWLRGVADGSKDAGRVASLMNEHFSDFVDIARDMGPAGVEAIQQIVAAANEAGVGLELIAQELADLYDEAASIMEERSQFLIDSASSLVNNLDTMLGDISTATARDIEFAATSVMQAFQMMQSAGMSFGEIVLSLGDRFGDIADRGAELGLDLGEEFTRMGEMMDIVGSEHVQNLLTRFEALADSVLLVADAGLLTQDQFTSLHSRIGEMYQLLQAEGITGAEAIALMAPQLQILMDASQQYGFHINENTRALIDQGLEMGILTDKGLTMEDILISGFDRMIVAINALIVAMGGVPVAFESWTGAGESMVEQTTNWMGELGQWGEDTADRVRRAWDRAAAAAGAAGDAGESAAGSTPPGDSPPSGGPPEPPPRGFQGGSHRFLDFGTGTPVRLHGREQVVTFDQGKSIAAMVGTAISNAQSSGGSERVERFLQELINETRHNTSTLVRWLNDVQGMKARYATARG